MAECCFKIQTLFCWQSASLPLPASFDHLWMIIRWGGHLCFCWRVAQSLCNLAPTWQWVDGCPLSCVSRDASYFKLPLFVHQVTPYLSSNRGLLKCFTCCIASPRFRWNKFLFPDGFILLACATQMWRKNGWTCEKGKTLQLQQGTGSKVDVG